jgi:2-polyprenyl-6-methoxyphenol hydroxylase-like FAD-dependent oxidoreductase
MRRLCRVRPARRRGPGFYNVSMMQAIDVLVRGGGVVGRTTALLLAQSRLRIGLLGQAPQRAESDVRAYALNAASRTLLQSLRAWPDAPHATPVLRMQVWGDQGGAVEFSADRAGCEALAWIVDVPALEARLDEALRYQPLVERIEQAPPAALTVVCEGKASASRGQRAIDYAVVRYPQHAVAARLRCARAHLQTARQWFLAAPTGAEVLALLPMADDELALVWSVPAPRAQALLAMDAADFETALREGCGGPDSANDPGPLRLSSGRSAWPLQRATASRWVEPGFALLGDAAHTVHPLAGQGLNLGLADAAELARVLAEREYWRSPGDLRLLRRYERARKAEVARTGLACDALERLFAHTDGRVQALRNWGMRGFAGSGPLKDWVARQAMGM